MGNIPQITIISSSWMIVMLVKHLDHRFHHIPEITTIHGNPSSPEFQLEPPRSFFPARWSPPLGSNGPSPCGRCSPSASAAVHRSPLPGLGIRVSSVFQRLCNLEIQRKHQVVGYDDMECLQIVQFFSFGICQWFNGFQWFISHLGYVKIDPSRPGDPLWIQA